MPFSFSFKFLRQINLFQSYYFIQQKSSESISNISLDTCSESHSENQQQVADVNEEYLTNINDCPDDGLLSPASVLLGLHEVSTTSASSGVAFVDCTILPTIRIIDQTTVLTDVDHMADNSMADNTCNDYDMISVSSWDIDLSVSGDEDAMEDEADSETIYTELKSETSTPENSPNIICCSAKSTSKSLETSMFFRKVCLKRRNAVRHECRHLHREPTWARHRPEHKICLHNKICPDSTCDDSDESDRGVTIEYFFDPKYNTIFSTMNEFRNEAIYGELPQFTSYSNPINIAKNRYSDIPCIEESRVKLIRNTVPIDPSDDDLFLPSIKITDYIHANWVDGYRQKNAYICTQGPLTTTVSDFWHMIIQYRAPIIVMTTRFREQNRDKCYEYWPENIGETKLITGLNDQYDSFEVTCLRSKEFGPLCPKNGICEHSSEHWYRVSLLQVKNCKNGVIHRVNHFYFHSWPDQGIPHSTKAFLHFILQIRRTYRLNIAKLGYESEMDQLIPPPPIVVHCSAGIGRTGTFVVTEICTKSLSDCGRLNLYQTLLKVRSQRYKSVQNCYQYFYCRNAIIDYARQLGMLPNSNDNNLGNEDAEDNEDEKEDGEEDSEEVEEYDEHEIDEYEEEVYEEQQVDNNVVQEQEVDNNKVQEQEQMEFEEQVVETDTEQGKKKELAKPINDIEKLD